MSGQQKERWRRGQGADEQCWKFCAAAKVAAERQKTNTETETEEEEMKRFVMQQRRPSGAGQHRTAFNRVGKLH